MQLEEYLDFQDSGAIRLKGHRIGIEHVIELYRGGYTVEEMVQHFPGLRLEQVHAAIAYYLHHQTELDSYMARLEAQGLKEYEAWARSPSPTIERLRTLRAQRDLARARCTVSDFVRMLQTIPRPDDAYLNIVESLAHDQGERWD